MARTKKQNIIPKEQAVFWMDKDGAWHNEHGELEHHKIIKYFNQSIQKDDNGYFLCQTINDVEEKVYFLYEETAVFVVDLAKKDAGIELTLNTLDTIILDPEALVIKKDALFMETDAHLIKFTQKALAKMTSFLKDTPQGLALNLGRTQTIIREK
ncbi:MFS transporter permease [uncultured Desulfobacter sp.]|uniref:MFS transporter permease n=1 Tax=uncultured Desulfobacter sp. TaxID=240139 RepID=UPI0029C81123|nr:MFS transporter permease [uncultured Desulfobacter sp.]